MSIKELAIVFPGQGAQKVGMGRDFFDNSPSVSDLFNKADEILGYSISDICFNGPDEELTKTLNTQPAIFVMSIAALTLLREKGFEPSMTAGHSVGEYAALVAAGVLSFEDGLRLVAKRGRLMQEAGTTAPGTMAAVIGLDYETIKKCCMDSYSAGIVEIANFNTPEQIVISGETAAVERAAELIKAKGAKRVMPLNVGAAFHSRLMKTAAESLATHLDGVDFKHPSMPVVVNATAEMLTDASKIKETLKTQMLGSVMWVDSIRAMAADGIDTFVEAGPGRALCGMIKKIDLSLTTLNIEDMATLEKTTESLNSQFALLQSA